VGKPST
jgi:hypothetical protein